MKNLLTDLDLSEVSLVDKGANPGAKIMLYKREADHEICKAVAQAAVARSRLALAKNAEHDQKSHGNRGGKPSSGDPLEDSARDALDSASEVQGRSKKFETLHERYGSTREGRDYLKVKEAYDRAGDYYESAASSFRRGNDLRGELLMDKAERWHDEADQLARLLGY